MKRKLVAGLGSYLAVPALVQSNIEIYGGADAGSRRPISATARNTTCPSGIAEGSRLGFKGTEDLGGVKGDIRS